MKIHNQDLKKKKKLIQIRQQYDTVKQKFIRSNKIKAKFERERERDYYLTGGLAADVAQERGDLLHLHLLAAGGPKP